MLATRWPLLKLLAQLQQSGDAASSCIGLWHPSLDWEEWRHQVDTAGRVTEALPYNGRQCKRCEIQFEMVRLNERIFKQ